MKNVRALILVSLFASITSILSIFLIPLPFTPVPITLQIIGVVLSGSILGARLGLYSQGLYALIGVIGLPVFAGGGSGLGTLFGPTGGYIFGFMAGAYVIGFLCQWGASQFPKNKISKYLLHFSAMGAGILVIYSFGTLQLMLVTGMDLPQAFLSGALPFLLPDLVKTGAAAFISVAVKEGLIKSRLISSTGEI